MVNAEKAEMEFNRNIYRVSDDEIYLKMESQANFRMYEYLNKMNDIIKSSK